MIESLAVPRDDSELFLEDTGGLPVPSCASIHESERGNVSWTPTT